jgi:hypothetical protein
MIALALLLLHGDSVSSSRIDLSGRDALVTFTFSVEDLSELARLDLDRSGVVEPAEWSAVLPAIFSHLGTRYRIDGCESEGDTTFLPPAVPVRNNRAPVTLRMRYRSAEPLDRLTIRCDFVRDYGENSRHVVDAPGGRVVVFDKDRSLIDGLRAAPPSRPALLLPWGAGAAALLLAAGGLVGLLRRRQLDALGPGGHGQEGVAHAFHDPLLPGNPG